MKNSELVLTCISVALIGFILGYLFAAASDYDDLRPVPTPTPAPILNKKPVPKHAVVEIYSERGIFASKTEDSFGL